MNIIFAKLTEEVPLIVLLYVCTFLVPFWNRIQSQFVSRVVCDLLIVLRCGDLLREWSLLGFLWLPNLNILNEYCLEWFWGAFMEWSLRQNLLPGGLTRRAIPLCWDRLTLGSLALFWVLDGMKMGKIGFVFFQRIISIGPQYVSTWIFWYAHPIWVFSTVVLSALLSVCLLNKLLVIK